MPSMYHLWQTLLKHLRQETVFLYGLSFGCMTGKNKLIAETQNLVELAEAHSALLKRVARITFLG